MGVRLRRTFALCLRCDWTNKWLSTEYRLSMLNRNWAAIARTITATNAVTTAVTSHEPVRPGMTEAATHSHLVDKATMNRRFCRSQTGLTRFLPFSPPSTTRVRLSIRLLRIRSSVDCVTPTLRRGKGILAAKAKQ